MDQTVQIVPQLRDPLRQPVHIPVCACACLVRLSPGFAQLHKALRVSHSVLPTRACSLTYQWARLSTYRHKRPHSMCSPSSDAPFGRVTTASVSSPRSRGKTRTLLESSHVWAHRSLTSETSIQKLAMISPQTWLPVRWKSNLITGIFSSSSFCRLTDFALRSVRTVCHLVFRPLLLCRLVVFTRLFRGVLSGWSRSFSCSLVSRCAFSPLHLPRGSRLVPAFCC